MDERAARSGAGVVLLCGRSFSGKSTVGRALGERLGAEVISLDGINESRGLRGGEGIPVKEWAHTHAQARELVRSALSSGSTVIVDDTSSPRFLRDGWRALSAELGAPLVLVFVDAPDDLVLTRMRANRQSLDRHDVSDAVMAAHLAGFEPPEPDEPHVRVDGGHPELQDLVAAVTAALR